MPYIHVLWCMHCVFDVCNTVFMVCYGQTLVWFAFHYISQRTTEPILWDDFVGFSPVQYLVVLECHSSMNVAVLSVIRS